MLQLFVNRLLQRPNQQSNIPVPRQVQQRNQTGPVTAGHSSSPNARTTDPVAPRASMLESPNGSTRVQDCQLNAAGGDISITYMNCTHLPTGNGKLAGENHLGRRRAEAETRIVNDEGAQIVQNTAKREEAKQELAGGNINGAIWSPEPEGCAIYVRNLLHKGHGWPFYVPGPSKNLSIVYREKGMRLGDVGIINVRGSFEFLFNICHSANHRINEQGVPKNFKQLRIRQTDIQEHSEFNGESSISSSSITNSSGLRFESSASEGAILAMPVGAISEDVAKIITFKKYALIHAEDWYRYIISCGRDVKNGDVRLVTGYHKSSHWCIATFANSTENDSQPFHLEFNHVTETNIGKVYEWRHSGTAQVRTGPGPQEDLDPDHKGRTYRNQSLFGRMICATLQENIWNELAEEFDKIEIDGDSTDGDATDDNPGPSNQGPTGSRRTNSSTTPSTSTSAHAPGQRSLAMIDNISTDPVIRSVSDSHQETTFPYHPSNTINKMLLELHPNARVAITSDNDWISVLQKDDLISPSTEQLCARIKASSIICRDKGAVFLEIPEPPTASPSIENDTKSLTIEPSASRVGGSIQSVDVLPTGKHPELLRTVTKHNQYYIAGGDLCLLVEGVQFRVHSYFFLRESCYFRQVLATPTSSGQQRPGTADSNPIVLKDVSADNFAKFLWVFYNPAYQLYDAQVSDWEVILDLSDRWGFSEVKNIAVRELEKKVIPDSQRIKLYHAYKVDRNILIPRYAVLCERDAPLTLEESQDIGLETMLKIAAVREEARASRLSTGDSSPLVSSSVELHDVIRKVFQIAPLPQTQIIQSIQPTKTSHIKTQRAKKPITQVYDPKLKIPKPKIPSLKKPIAQVFEPKPKVPSQKGEVDNSAVATPEEAK